MPLINFTPGDILRQKLIPEGWYGAKITQILGPKQSSKGDSINFDFDFTLDEKSPAPGKVITRTFNSKAIGMLVPLIAACRGVTVETITNDPTALKTFDTEECLNKQIDVKVIRDLYEGQMSNKVDGFLPRGMGSSIPF